jgi:Tfp pilus assembly protein PilV
MEGLTYKGRNGLVRRGGFTLAEALTAVVVLSIAVAGIILPFTVGAAARVEGMNQTLAAKLASDQMEKIINTSFDDILSNYNYTETQGEVEDYNGNFFTSSNYAGFSRQTSCEYYPTPGVESYFIKATVSVSHEGQELISLTRLIGK